MNLQSCINKNAMFMFWSTSRTFPLFISGVRRRRDFYPGVIGDECREMAKKKKKKHDNAGR